MSVTHFAIFSGDFDINS